MWDCDEGNIFRNVLWDYILADQVRCDTLLELLLLHVILSRINVRMKLTCGIVHITGILFPLEKSAVEKSD